jgi:hypothetical protein
MLALFSILAPPAHGSAPPRRSVLVDIRTGTIGPLGVVAKRLSPLQAWGPFDYALDEAGRPMITLVWSRSADPLTAWAVATMPSPTSQLPANLRFLGSFRTTQGDKPGTSLATFLRHWPAASPVTPVVRKGKRIEYNVVLGKLVFAFDNRKILRGVGLTRTAPRTFCVLPLPCLGSTLQSIAN